MLRPVKENTGRPRAKENTAKEMARDMEIKEEVNRGVDPRKADALSVEGSTGPPSAPRMLSREEAASPRPESKGGIWKKR